MGRGEKEEVIIIIPIYKAELNTYERAAVANNLKVLDRYPAVFLKPIGLRLPMLSEHYPFVEQVEVSDDWLGEKNGIAGYNQMMLSASFYRMFLQYEYILICHTDAWVFSDQLKAWCVKGFDHVASPWATPYHYRFLPLRFFARAWHRLINDHRIQHYDLFGKIGNGGFSLRRTESFLRVCAEQPELIASYPYNEDVFWAMAPLNFSVPTEQEAYAFSFDQKPKLCLQYNHGVLPMACHGFHHRKHWRKVWKKYINIELR